MAVLRSRRVGLARTLSKLGYCSRSQAAQMIRAGRVTLQGRIRRDPEFAVSDFASIAVDGKLAEPLGKIYIVLNKPRGIVTTASDEKGRDTVYSLLQPHCLGASGERWIAPVGRLDKASEGLLLLTNDSEWGALIASPAAHIPKTYHVQIATLASDEFLRSLTQGVKTDKGKIFGAKSASLLRSGQKNSWIEVVLDEGKNRQIRRMMEALSIEVLRLIRVAIGPLQLGDLKKGGHRSLTAQEKKLLNKAISSGDTNLDTFSQRTAN